MTESNSARVGSDFLQSVLVPADTSDPEQNMSSICGQRAVRFIITYYYLLYHTLSPTVTKWRKAKSSYILEDFLLQVVPGYTLISLSLNFVGYFHNRIDVVLHS